jgi:hypothetical protein
MFARTIQNFNSIKKKANVNNLSLKKAKERHHTRVIISALGFQLLKSPIKAADCKMHLMIT